LPELSGVEKLPVAKWVEHAFRRANRDIDKESLASATEEFRERYLSG